MINWLWCASGSTCYPALDTAYNCPAWCTQNLESLNSIGKCWTYPISSVTWPLLCMDINHLSYLESFDCWVYWIHMKDQRFRFESFMVALLVKVEVKSNNSKKVFGIWSSYIFIDVPFFRTGKVCSPCSTIIFSWFIYLHMPPLNHSTDICNYPLVI